MHGRAGLASVLLVCCFAAIPGAAAATKVRSEPEPSFSNPRVSHWAHSLSRATLRRGPSDGAPVAGRLRLQTEDGPREVYPVVGQRRDSRDDLWYRVRIPGRPNGRIGWARRREFGLLHELRSSLVINRHRLTATLTRGRRRIWSSRIGVGAPATPTPAGRFWIRERLRPKNPRGLYGPWAFGTSAYSRLTDWPGGGVVGIHGTDMPWLIPGRPSHGCVRVPNAAVRRLAGLLPIGTPVRIR